MSASKRRPAITMVNALPQIVADLHGSQGQVSRPVDRDTFPYELESRSLWCITYMLDDRLGRLCGNCPHLPDDEKIAMALERHGVPSGAPSGEAEKRAIEHGLQRPSMRRALQAKQQRRAGQPTDRPPR
jgi:hypothetical protein